MSEQERGRTTQDAQDPDYLGSGPIRLSEKDADLLREKIIEDKELRDGMAEEHRELQKEYREYQTEMEFRLWAGRIGGFLLGSVATWVILNAI